MKTFTQSIQRFSEIGLIHGLIAVARTPQFGLGLMLRFCLAFSLVFSTPFGVKNAASAEVPQGESNEEEITKGIPTARFKEITELLKRLEDRVRSTSEVPNPSELEALLPELDQWRSNLKSMFIEMIAHYRQTNIIESRIKLNQSLGIHQDTSSQDETEDDEPNSVQADLKFLRGLQALRETDPSVVYFTEISNYFGIALRIEELMLLAGARGRAIGFAEEWMPRYGLHMNWNEFTSDSDHLYPESSVIAWLADQSINNNVFRITIDYQAKTLDIHLQQRVEWLMHEKRAIFEVGNDPIKVVQHIAMGYLVKNFAQVGVLLSGRAHESGLPINIDRPDLIAYLRNFDALVDEPARIRERLFIDPATDLESDGEKAAGARSKPTGPQLKPEIMQQLEEMVNAIPQELIQAALRTRAQYLSQEDEQNHKLDETNRFKALESEWQLTQMERLKREAPTMVIRYLTFTNLSQLNDESLSEILRLTVQEIFLRQVREQLNWSVLQASESLDNLNKLSNSQLEELSEQEKAGSQAVTETWLNKMAEKLRLEAFSPRQRMDWQIFFPARSFDIPRANQERTRRDSINEARQKYLERLLEVRGSLLDIIDPEDPKVDLLVLRHALGEEFRKDRFKPYGFQQHQFSRSVDQLLNRMGQEESFSTAVSQFRVQIIQLLNEGFSQSHPNHWRPLLVQCVRNQSSCDAFYGQMMLDLTRDLFTFPVPRSAIEQPRTNRQTFRGNSALRLSMTMNNRDFFRQLHSKLVSRPIDYQVARQESFENAETGETETRQVNDQLSWSGLNTNTEIAALNRVPRAARELLFQMLLMGYWTGVIDNSIEETTNHSQGLRLSDLKHISESVKSDYKKRLTWSIMHRLPILGVKFDHELPQFDNTSYLQVEPVNIATLMDWLNPDYDFQKNWTGAREALKVTQSNIFKAIESIMNPYQSGNKVTRTFRGLTDSLLGRNDEPQPTQNFLQAVGNSLYLQNEMAALAPEAFRRLHQSLDYNPLQSDPRLVSDGAVITILGPVLMLSLSLLGANLAQQYLGFTAFGRIAQLFINIVQASGGMGRWIGVAIMTGFVLLVGKTGWEYMKQDSILSDLIGWNQTSACVSLGNCDLWIDDEIIMMQQSIVDFLARETVLQAGLLAGFPLAFMAIQSTVGPKLLYRLRMEILVQKHRAILSLANIHSAKHLGQIVNREALEAILIAAQKRYNAQNIFRRQGAFDAGVMQARMKVRTQAFLRELDQIGRFSDRAISVRALLPIKTLTNGNPWPANQPVTSDALSYLLNRWHQRWQAGEISTIKMNEIRAAFHNASKLVNIRNSVIPEQSLFTNHFRVRSGEEIFESIRRSGSRFDFATVDVSATAAGPSTRATTGSRQIVPQGHGGANRSMPPRNGDEFVTPRYNNPTFSPPRNRVRGSSQSTPALPRNSGQRRLSE